MSSLQRAKIGYDCDVRVRRNLKNGEFQVNDHCDYARENHFNKLLCAFIASHSFSMMWAKYITGLIRKGLR